MDDPANHLTWEIDDEGLSRADARALRKAVDTCAHWLQVWDSYVRASVARSVTLVVALHDADEMALTTDRDNARLQIALPKALSDEDNLQTEVVVGALEAVEAAARMFPHSPPSAIWEPTPSEEPDETRGQGVKWQLMEPDEMLVIGTFTGADQDGLSMFHMMDEYVCERVAKTGVAEVVDTEGGLRGAAWTVALS